MLLNAPITSVSIKNCIISMFFCESFMDCNFQWESLVNQILTNLNYLKKIRNVDTWNFID